MLCAILLTELDSLLDLLWLLKLRLELAFLGGMKEFCFEEEVGGDKKRLGLGVKEVVLASALVS